MSPRAAKGDTSSVGMAVDSAGNVAYDPSSNVLDLVEAAVKRNDDLLAAEVRRQDDLRAQSERHTAEMATLRAYYDEKLRDAEAKRIDAIRAIDVNAVSVASGRAADQATVLASQVQVSADALRSLVATSASTLAAAQAASTAEITKRLSELERAKYEGAGRSTVADPMLEKLVARMEILAATQATGTGKSAGAGALWGYIGGAIGLLATLVMLWSFTTRNTAQPQPIYVPAPPSTLLPASPPGAVPR